MFVMIESPQNTQTLHFSKWNVTDQKEKAMHQKEKPSLWRPLANGQLGRSINL